SRRCPTAARDVAATAPKAVGDSIESPTALFFFGFARFLAKNRFPLFRGALKAGPAGDVVGSRRRREHAPRAGRRSASMAYGAVWVPVTLLASTAQTLRNAMQRDLIGALGAVGAAHVRFLFGLPFAAMFLAGVMAATGLSLPR